MRACYLLKSSNLDCLKELRKYFLVVNCRINDGIDELGINSESVSISTFKEDLLLGSSNVQQEIKDMYFNCSCPGVSTIFNTASKEWATLLKLEVN